MYISNKMDHFSIDKIPLALFNTVSSDMVIMLIIYPIFSLYYVLIISSEYHALFSKLFSESLSKQFSNF